MDRRTFLKRSLAGAITLHSLHGYTQETPESFGKPLGTMPVRKSSEITSSPLSIGFETLDRRGFDPERTYPHIEALGVKWARCQTGWGRCETTRGRYDFSWLDKIVDTLLNMDIQPWFNLGYGNRIHTVGALDEAAVGYTPAYDEAAMLAWVKYVDALAKHFKDKVRHYEIWNEPNHSGFWRPRDPDAKVYVKLVARTAPVIRSINPEARIIGGALAGVPFDFISACFREGIKEHIDVLSFHPYRERPEEKYDDEINRLRKLLEMQSAACTLWQGENGCPSVGGTGSAGALSELPWDETLQAKWLLRRIMTDLKNELELTSYFHIVDLVGYQGETNYKGLLRGNDYTPKPAYYAYQRLCALFDAETKVTAKQDNVLEYVLPDDSPTLNASEIQQVSFSRKGGLIHACWCASRLFEPWTDVKATIKLQLNENTALTEPVLLDPLSGNVYAVPDAAISDNVLSVNSMPLSNYPLFIADRTLVLA